MPPRRARGAPTTPHPALDDAPLHARLHVDADDTTDARSEDTDAIDSDDGRGARHATTARMVQLISGDAGVAMRPEEILAHFNALNTADGNASDTSSDASDTESEASEEGRGVWYPLYALPLSRDVAAETLTRLRGEETAGRIPEGISDASALLSEDKVYLSESLTRWRRAATVLFAPPDEKLKCYKCRDVAAEPMVNAEGRLFCGPCGKEVEGEQRASIFGLDVQTQKKIDELVIACCHATEGHRLSARKLDWKMGAKGCKSIFRLRDAREHEAQCDFALTRCGLPGGCLNEAEKCHEVFPRKDVEEHQQQCRHRPVRCLECQRVVQARKLRAHMLLCGQMEVYCPYRRCRWRGPRDDVENHVATDCEAHPVVCRIEDSENRTFCQEIIPRSRLREHQASCQYQRRPCEFCQREVSLRQMGAHKSRCTAREYRCPRCSRTMPQSQAEQHQRTTCPIVASSCEHARFGCREVVVNEGYRDHAIEALPQHISHVTFGPAGVVDMINEPGKDQIDTVALLKRMRDTRESMLHDFRSFEDSCEQISSRLESACEFSRKTSNEIALSSNAFRRESAKDRVAADIALSEKKAVLKDEEYHDIIVQTNLASAAVVEETQNARERARMLQIETDALEQSLLERVENAEQTLSRGGASNLSVQELTERVKREARARFKVIQGDASTHAAEERLVSLAAALRASVASVRDGIEHRRRTADVLEAKLKAVQDGRHMDSNALAALHRAQRVFSE